MLFIDMSNPSQAGQRVLVTNMAAQRITGIRRLYNHTTAMNNINGLLDQTQLWMRGVYFQVLTH